MNKKVIGLFKEELVEKIITKYFAVGQKIYSYLMDDGKKATGTKKCVIKRELKFNSYEDCNKATQLNSIIKYLEK